MLRPLKHVDAWQPSKHSEMTELKEDQAGKRRVVQVYEEQDFDGADLTRTVHIGWGVTLGACWPTSSRNSVLSLS